MEFLSGIIVGIAIGFIWGVWRATQSFIQRIVDNPEEIKEIMSRIERISKEDTESDKQVIPEIDQEYRTEYHHGMCYLYDSKDNFMAQGSDIIEAMNNAERRFPGLKLNFRINDPNKSNQ